MLWNSNNRERIAELQSHGKNSEIKKLADWLLDGIEEFDRNKFTQIINVAEKMQSIAENCKRQRGMKGGKQ
jgi:hypothetical protein